MKRPGSIARMMIAIAALGLVASRLPGWIGPRNEPGELGATAVVAALGLVGAIVTGGRRRRFCLGLSAGGIVVGVGFLAAPQNLRDRVFQLTVAPVLARLSPTPPGLTPEELASLWMELGENPNQEVSALSRTLAIWSRMRRPPFSTVRSQILLAFWELPIALIGGLIASVGPATAGRTPIVASRSTAPVPMPPDRP